jgi:hypothetical protein
MNVAIFSEWFEELPLPSRIAAIALIYSNLTVGARQMFVPDWTAEKNQRERALEILHGLNEIHHTLSNLLLDYATQKQLSTLSIHYSLPTHLATVLKKG